MQDLHSVGFVILFLMSGISLGLAIAAFLYASGQREIIEDMQRRLAAAFNRIRHLEHTTSPTSQDSTIGASKITEQPSAFLSISPLSPEAISRVAQKMTENANDKAATLAPEPKPTPTPVSKTVQTVAPAPHYEGANTTTKKFGLEEVIGKRWLTWAGVLILFLSAGFFLKYAFQRDLIAPAGQVCLCALCGIMLLAGGLCLLRLKMRTLAQGLQGLGLAVLYVTLTAAFSIYEPPVLGQTPAFLLMTTVTALGIFLAVHENALAVALLSLLGGLATPLLVSTGHNSRDILLAYLLLLDVGVMAVAYFRQWRILDSVALAGTYVLFVGWYLKYYSDAQLIPTLLWLGVFYLIFLTLPFLFHYRNRTPVAVERFILALSNAFCALAMAWSMLYDDYQQTLGCITLGLTAIYTALAILFRKRNPKDTKTVFAACAFAVTFLTLTLPLQLSANALTIAWAAEAPLVLYIGFRFHYLPLRIFSILVALVATVQVFHAHWPLHKGLFSPFCNDNFLTSFTVAATLLLCGIIGQRLSARESNTEGIDKGISQVFWAGGGLFALLLIQQECFLWLRPEYSKQLALVASALIWLGGSLAYLFGARTAKTARFCLPGALALVIGLVYVLSTMSRLRSAERLLFLNQEFLAAGVGVLTLLLYAHVLRGMKQHVWSALCAGSSALLLFSLLTNEVSSFADEVLSQPENAIQLWVTIAWGGYAALLLITGFWRRQRWIRYSALALLAIAALKLLVLDMCHSNDLLRIIAFVVVGILLLGASFFYHKLEKRILQAERNKKEQ